MPTLHILAGPNGAGKTTFYNAAVEANFISRGIPFINIDNIAKQELGDYSESSIARAKQIYSERVGKLIQKMQDFMIESNLSQDSDYTWIEKMKQKG